MGGTTGSKRVFGAASHLEFPHFRTCLVYRKLPPPPPSENRFPNLKTYKDLGYSPMSGCPKNGKSRSG
jgi:hypothetical protein